VVTVPFLGNMLPANETPPTSINSSATAIILVTKSSTLRRVC
jgi:hypothetical protein